ncbi:MAG TPA: HEPN domain-containing protein [Bdellovibrionota bacterium]|nr:HEPN domain-containing protein [Bdellovibrionota bacterium]
MKNRSLTKDYLIRAEHRLAAVDLLFSRGAFADVVREAQEAVELMLKALLRTGRIEIPRIHDVGDILLENRQRFSKDVQPHLERFAEISRQMRRDRELAFYGSEDLTPSEFYKKADAERALGDARFIWEKLRPFAT